MIIIDPAAALAASETPEKITPSRIATKVVTFIVGGAVSATAVSLIHQNTTTYNKRQTAQLYIGAYVIGAMIADKAEEYVAAKVQPNFKLIEDWLWIPVESETPAESKPDETIKDIPTEQ